MTRPGAPHCIILRSKKEETTMPLPIFRTDRLLLRPWNPTQDAIAALGIYGDPRMMAGIAPGTVDRNLAAVVYRLRRYAQVGEQGKPQGCWAVMDLRRGQTIGNLLLLPLGQGQRSVPGLSQPQPDRLEIGWHFHPNHWGQGYATEAAREILDYGLSFSWIPALYAVVLPGNDRSYRIAHRLGMIPLGQTRRYYGGQPLQVFKKVRDRSRSGLPLMGYSQPS